VAFEPFAGVRQLIEQKVAVNNLKHVEIIPFALGDIDDTLPYYPGGAANSGTGTFMPEEAGIYRQPVELQIRNGDRLFAEKGPAPYRSDEGGR
jgi:hypothetical protein